MKTIQKTIIAILTILCTSLCHAQQVQPTPEQWLGVQQHMIKSAPYILEGTVTEERTYNEKNKVISTSIIQITKIYRGTPQLKLGSIRVVTGQAVKSGDMVAIEYDGGGGMELSKGGRYVIFCKSADSSLLIDSTATNNTITLAGMDCCNYPIVFNSNGTAQWGMTQYKTVEDIDAFFQESGLTIQQEVPADGAKH